MAQELTSLFYYILTINNYEYRTSNNKYSKRVFLLKIKIEMISKYNNFILERALNESTLYVSPEILKRLQKIDSEISNDLIENIE